MINQQEVIANLKTERSELVERHIKLNNFLEKRNAEVSDVQFRLMKMQSGYMQEYVDILNKRIDDLEKEVRNDE